MAAIRHDHHPHLEWVIKMRDQESNDHRFFWQWRVYERQVSYPDSIGSLIAEGQTFVSEVTAVIEAQDAIRTRHRQLRNEARSFKEINP